MRSLRRIVFALAALVGTVAVVAFVGIRRNGLAADRPPSRLETAVARRIVALSIPTTASAASNPHAGDLAAWRPAAAHFADHCAACHGSDGRGRSELGPHMYPPVPDLTSGSIQELSDGDLFWIIQNGVRWTGMPAFRDAHTTDETWRLVSFVRHLSSVGVNDSQEAGRQNETSTSPNTVVLDGTTFVPAQIDVKAGDTITWVNRDPFPHDVTAADGRFHATLQPNEQWQFRPTTPGRIEYVCTLHPGMKGVFVVQ